jgi:hypothetical protein
LNKKWNINMELAFSIKKIPTSDQIIELFDKT